MLPSFLNIHYHGIDLVISTGSLFGVLGVAVGVGIYFLWKESRRRAGYQVLLLAVLVVGALFGARFFSAVLSILRFPGKSFLFYLGTSGSTIMGGIAGGGAAALLFRVFDRRNTANDRALDRALREKIATWSGGKGELLEEVLGDRRGIADSDQGRSFHAFYDFLLSAPRQEEFADLLARVQQGDFREDLYYRIGVVKITLPPLLDRKNDIQPLLTHFWRHHSGMDYSDGALDLLMKYDWPGNVRQLRNFADRMVALKGGRGLVETEDVERFIEEQHMVASNLPVSTGRTVEEAGQELIYRAIMQLGNEVRLLRELILTHLPPEVPAEQAASSPYPSESPRSMEQMEQQLIEKVLDETGGNRKEAARRLGIGERTLYRKIKKYGLR